MPLGYDCLFNNLSNGCVRVLVLNTQHGDLIPAGEGPVVRLEYDVSGEAPENQWDLDSGGLVVAEDEQGNFLLTGDRGIR